MLLAYDGTQFQGWQRLGKEERTIQGLLENTISELAGEAIEVIGSGRTDAGVHAKGQVANFKVRNRLPDSFLETLNQKLPPDIVVQKLDLAAEGFHSRLRATGKAYRYLVDTNERPSVFRRKYVYHFPMQLDICAMKEAANCLLGRLDYTSFTDDKSDRSKVREIHEIQIREKDGIVEFIYLGDGFLYHMVRILTGTLLEVGLGKITVQEIPEILCAKERKKAGFLVPANGLFLDKVYYS